MGPPKNQLLANDLAKLVAMSGEQAGRLNEMNWLAVDGGIEIDVTEGQVLTLARHQTALAGLVLTLLSGRAKRRIALPRPTFVATSNSPEAVG